MPPLQILPSTTSHKHEALLPTLALFARLGFTDLDLNLNHIIERGEHPEAVAEALAANRQRVWIVSGGWCDFFDEGPAAELTRRSVARQAELARAFGVDRLRLFFGRLPADGFNAATREACVRNITRVAGEHADLLLVFENHDGASSRPDVCRAILDDVSLPNVRLTFDAINFEHRGVPTADALALLQPWVAHVHLKGYDRSSRRDGSPAGTFCGFGEGDVDLTPALRTLIRGGYTGALTVEYEGDGDRTLRLYDSVGRARAAIQALTTGA